MQLRHEPLQIALSLRHNLPADDSALSAIVAEAKKKANIRDTAARRRQQAEKQNN